MDSSNNDNKVEKAPAKKFYRFKTPEEKLVEAAAKNIGNVSIADSDQSRLAHEIDAVQKVGNVAQPKPKFAKPQAIADQIISEQSIVAPLPNREEIFNRREQLKKIPAQKIVPTFSTNKGLKLGSALENDDFDSPRSQESLNFESSSHDLEKPPLLKKAVTSNSNNTQTAYESSQNYWRQSVLKPKLKPEENQKKSGKGILGFFR